VWALAHEAGPDKGAAVLVLAYCGLRWGELAGLHLADIDTLRRDTRAARGAAATVPDRAADRGVPIGRADLDRAADVDRVAAQVDSEARHANTSCSRPPAAATPNRQG
jgi:integrase